MISSQELLDMIHTEAVESGPQVTEPGDVSPVVWMVAQVLTCGKLSTQGVFDTEAGAVAACRDYRYFVGPLQMNQVLPHESVPWPGAYYPIVATSDTVFPDSPSGEVAIVALNIVALNIVATMAAAGRPLDWVRSHAGEVTLQYTCPAGTILQIEIGGTYWADNGLPGGPEAVASISYPGSGYSTHVVDLDELEGSLSRLYHFDGPDQGRPGITQDNP